jgi:hypothetical protein
MFSYVSPEERVPAGRPSQPIRSILDVVKGLSHARCCRVANLELVRPLANGLEQVPLQVEFKRGRSNFQPELRGSFRPELTDDPPRAARSNRPMQSYILNSIGLLMQVT